MFRHVYERAPCRKEDQLGDDEETGDDGEYGEQDKEGKGFERLASIREDEVIGKATLQDSPADEGACCPREDPRDPLRPFCRNVYRHVYHP